MDLLRFEQAKEKIIGTSRDKQGIGTLGEKTLHAVLKHYFQPDTQYHEQKTGSFVADIADYNGITEIQTRDFNKLRKKLEDFLTQTFVTVVYPIADIKWLVWLDEQGNEAANKRKSPKRGQPYQIFTELYKIKPLLTNNRLSFRIVMLDIVEYRSLNGWSQDKKKGSSRFERIPVQIKGEIDIRSVSDYSRLIPPACRKSFTTKDFKKESGLSLSGAQTALNVLYAVGAVLRVGKTGGLYLYDRSDSCMEL